MRRILIVDDGEENRLLIEALLRGDGYEVRAAKNGAEALDCALADPPDLIISDILMPVMDGFGLCRNVKMQDRLRGIPFLFYSATYTDPKDEAFALSLGADRFLVKPQEPETLLAVIRELFSSPLSVTAERPGDELPDESRYFKDYSEALFRKLGKKAADLEKTNLDLERIIQDRIRGEEALRASELKYRIVAENTYSWEFWRSPEGAFRFLSSSCRRVTGHESAEFLKDPGLKRRIIHPDDLPSYEAHQENVEMRREAGSLEFRILHADGTYRWIAHDCQPVFADDGAYLGVRGSNRDVTGQKQLEEQLRQSQKMEAIGQLAGGVAHDFNNILTGIMGYAQILQTRMEKDSPLRGFVDQILGASERASNLTQSLLLFSRRQEAKLQPVNLNALIRNMEKFLKRIIGEDIELKTSLSEETITLHADSGMIEQVIMNLIVNARDAIRAGGVLSIETDLIDIDEEFVRLHGYGAPGRYALMSVTDTGIGMDGKTRERLFEPFFTTKEAGKGTGLGLSIVYGIVKRHNGYINVYSEPGQGATFRLFFPCAEAGIEQASPKTPVDPPRGVEAILVVDDDPVTRQLLELYLTSLGYQVILAEDGQDAVDKLRSRADGISLVIMDTIMPRKSGKEAAREMRRFREDVRILFMSGYPPDTVRDRGLLEEGATVMMKPLKLLHLAQTAREAIDRPCTRTQA